MIVNSFSLSLSCVIHNIEYLCGIYVYINMYSMYYINIDLKHALCFSQFKNLVFSFLLCFLASLPDFRIGFNIANFGFSANKTNHSCGK